MRKASLALTCVIAGSMALLFDSGLASAAPPVSPGSASNISLGSQGVTLVHDRWHRATRYHAAPYAYAPPAYGYYAPPVTYYRPPVVYYPPPVVYYPPPVVRYYSPPVAYHAYDDDDVDYYEPRYRGRYTVGW